MKTITIFVCCFHRNEVVIIIVFVAIKLFYYVRIFKVSLLLSISKESAWFEIIFDIVFLFLMLVIVAFPISYIFHHSVAVAPLSSSLITTYFVISFMLNSYNQNSFNRIKERIHCIWTLIIYLHVQEGKVSKSNCNNVISNIK